MMRRGLCALLLALVLSTGSRAAEREPPGTVSYQAVVRDSSGTPLDGPVNIVFRFYDSPEPGVGEELLRDERTGPAALIAVGGLIQANVGQRSGGLYPDMQTMFGNTGLVWLEVEVEGQRLQPRVAVDAVPYAHNATYFAGRRPGDFIDTSVVRQRKFGGLELDGGHFDLINSPGDFLVGSDLFRFKVGVAIAGGDAGDVYLGSYGGSNRTYIGGGSIPRTLTVTPGRVGIGVASPSHPFEVFSESLGAGARFDTAITAATPSIVEVAAIEQISPALYRSTALLAYADVGINATGESVSGLFSGPQGAFAILASGTDPASNYGIHAQGTASGGVFEDTDQLGSARLAWGNRGIWAYGDFAGGTFSLLDGQGTEIGFADVARSSGTGTPYKIFGTGTVSFVQNHPERPDHVVVYAAPEGGEVATYTRGSARLQGGATVVTLEESFQHVTNPDLGLTAHLTPRGLSCAMHVASISTRELAVASDDPACADVAFDYFVYGLRIGFERHMAVQPKEQEAPLPRQEAFESFAATRPDLVPSTALARYRSIEESVAGRSVDLSRADALMARITSARDPRLVPTTPGVPARRGSSAVDAGAQREGSVPVPEAPLVVDPTVSRESPSPAAARSAVAAPTIAPVSGSVLAGDVLVLDTAVPGALRPADAAFDRGVAGCAIEAPEGVDLSAGHAALATSGIALCRVDAGETGIAVGDVLVTSATLAHATRGEASSSGVVLGKAMEPLAAGTGLIRVLVTLR